MNKQHTLWVATAFAITLALSGCSDDDDDDLVTAPPPASTEVPDSAGASTASIFSYLMSLSASDDSSEPLTLKDSFAVPPDEVSEPTPLP